MTDIEVGEPEFFTPTVSLGNTSYTSYDKYAETNGIAKRINGDTTVGTTMGANNCQPETLYSPSAVIGGISENLIKNSNYVKKISFLVDGDSKSSYENEEVTSNSQTGANVTSLSWGSHTLTATFEFDGKSVTSAPKTHHITGLPYSIDFKNQSAAPNWIWNINTDKCKYSSGNGHCICYGYTNLFSGNAFSCSFITPPDENVNVSYITKHYFVNTGWTSAKATIYNGISKDDKTIVKTSSIETESESMGLSDTPIGSREISLPGTGEISNGSRISISCDVTDRAITNKQFIYIYSLEVKYN